MRKNILSILVGFLMVFGVPSVEACGEIKELNSNIGTVSIVDSSNYLITIPEGVREVTLFGSTDYDWVKGYSPRTVSVDDKVELKVDGNACGYGIYTYFVRFKTISNLIAENTQVDDNSSNNTEDQETSTNNDDKTSETSNTEPVLLLSGLEIDGFDIEFDPKVTEYDLEVKSSTKKIDISTTVTESNINVSVSSNAEKLEEGKNKVVITLEDDEDHKQEYILNVIRPKAKSDNNYLSGLSIEGYQLNFDPGITSYDLEIGKESILSINAVTESELAHAEILGNANLSNGSSITIRVTAEDESVRDYIINISRSFNIMDYWMYIVIVGLVIFLIILLIISKSRKKKKAVAAPSEVAVQTETAGIVQDPSAVSTTQNVNTNTTEDTFKLDGSSTNATLQIIEPTNIENQPLEEVFNTNTQVDEDTSPTEVFKL